MADGQTARLKLPLLWAGQAQKEVFHNEALTLIDLELHASVAAVGAVSVPAKPEAVDAWIVGAGANGDWAGKADSIAGWTDGGWRFVDPVEGMTLWSRVDATFAQFRSGGWTVGEIVASRLLIDGEQVVAKRLPGIAAAAGGDVIDVQARAAISAVLDALKTHGLIAAE